MGLRRGNAIFFRLMVVFLLIILPISSIGLAFCGRSIALQDQIITSVMQQNLSTEMEKLTTQMQQLQVSLVNYGYENKLSILSSRPGDLSAYERSQVINNTQRRLYEMHMSNPHIHMLSLYITAVGIRLHSTFYHVADATIFFVEDAEIMESTALAYAYGNKTVVAPGSIRYYYTVPIFSTWTATKIPRLLFRVDYDIPAIISSLTGALEGMGLFIVIADANGEPLITNLDSPETEEAFKALSTNDERKAALTDKSVTMVELGGSTFYTLLFRATVPYADFYFLISRDEALAPTLHMRAWIWILCAIFALAVILYSWYAYARVQKPVTSLMDGFKRLEGGQVSFQIESNASGEFATLTQGFNSTLKRLEVTIAQLYEQRILVQEAELKHLQAQINPHFLYNNFYILDNMLLMEDYEIASSFCRLLGDYFKYVTKSNQITATLSEEFQHAMTYASIQKMRFGDRLTVTFPSDEDISSLGNPSVPRVILQPILENAFKHALERQNGGAELSVWVYCEDGKIHIVVENDGPFLSPEMIADLQESLNKGQIEKGTGLYNVHRRLVIMHGTELSLCARPQGGLRVEITLQKGEAQTNAL